uniref:Uncharacterized protein n=1 Tax=viral metagenome TaxID=1070528 RepID=A0A6C0II05_9ZZZZ
MLLFKIKKIEIIFLVYFFSKMSDDNRIPELGSLTIDESSEATPSNEVVSVVHESSEILKIAKKTLSSYTKQENTGNVYEMYVILSLLRKMGLTDINIDELKPTLEIIEKQGKGNIRTLSLIPIIKKMPLQNELWFDGHNIIDMMCLTQEDDIGGTGDIMLITKDKKELSISIREGTIPRSDILNKVVNPSCSNYGCSKEDVESIKAIEKESLIEYKKKHGDDKSRWPKRENKCSIKIGACMKVVELYEKRFDTYEPETKRTIMNDIHHIHKKPADYICLVNKKFTSSGYFRIGDCKINKDTWIPIIKTNSVFIRIFDKDTLVSNTQVKHNNGINSSMRKWNVNLVVSNLYDVTKLGKNLFNAPQPSTDSPN